MPQRLWEIPKDAFPRPFADHEEEFAGWEELSYHADQDDDEANIIIWWDWSPPYDGYPNERITLYFARPDRERVCPWTAPVHRDQEPEIRAWLWRRLARLADWWNLEPEKAGA